MPLRSEAEAEADSGLGGRLFTRVLGGCGKAPTLVVLRKVLPGVGRADVGGELELAEFVAGLVWPLVKETVFIVGTAGVVLALLSFGVGSPDDVTARFGVIAPGVGMPEAAELEREPSSGISGSGLRVFAMGSAGRGPVGGGCGGRDDVLWGSAEVMVAVADIDIEPMRPPVLSPSSSCTFPPTIPTPVLSTGNARLSVLYSLLSLNHDLDHSSKCTSPSSSLYECSEHHNGPDV